MYSTKRNSATPAIAQNATTASGGVFHLTSMQNTIAAIAKSIGAWTALVHAGE
jgi:hypothetical protein